VSSAADPYADILAELRAAVVAGAQPDEDALTERIRAVGGDPAAEQRALQQLARVLSVHRARTAVAREPERRPAGIEPSRLAVGRGPRRALIKTRVTVTGNMDVRRGGTDAAPTLVWEAAANAGVTEWEVRFSDRPDPRRDYEVRETTTLPGDARSVPLVLGDHPVRVHLLGRGRGKLVRRAIVSSVTRQSWSERWERRPSAS
jgi:hypothetical protein